jgi:hypothetical protein
VLPPWAPLPALIAFAAAGLAMLQRRRARTRGRLVLGVRLTATPEDELTFTVATANTGVAPTEGVVVRAAVGGEQVAQLEPFDLPPDRNRSVQVAVPRPRLGTVVPECGDLPTLYGEPFVVTATDTRGATASAEWREPPLARQADPARYEAMQRVWADAGKTRKSF